MPFLYRGTTIGFPGNQCLQRARLTPASSDPLVAVLFGIECSRWGPAVLLLADAADLALQIATGNVLSELEQEVVVTVSPTEFSQRYALHQVPIESARFALHKIGYELPIAISSREALNEEIKVWRRLSMAEIARFDAIVLEGRVP